MLVHELAIAIASQQVENYIVPRTTLELSSNTNKSAGKYKFLLAMCSLSTVRSVIRWLFAFWKGTKALNL